MTTLPSNLYAFGCRAHTCPGTGKIKMTEQRRDPPCTWRRLKCPECNLGWIVVTWPDGSVTYPPRKHVGRPFNT